MKKTYRPQPKNNEYPDFDIVGTKYCEWIYREGNLENIHYAYTPCKPGFNFLGKSEDKRYADHWNNGQCPICGKPIHINYIQERKRRKTDENNR